MFDIFVDKPLSLSGPLDLNTGVPELLRKTRLAKQLTQQDLAQQTGVSLRTIKSFEKGENISLHNFLLIVYALNEGEALLSSLAEPTFTDQASEERFLRGQTPTSRCRKNA